MTSVVVTRPAENAIGLKIGAAPGTQVRDNQVFSTRHRLHFVRVHTHRIWHRQRCLAQSFPSGDLHAIFRIAQKRCHFDEADAHLRLHSLHAVICIFPEARFASRLRRKAISAWCQLASNCAAKFRSIAAKLLSTSYLLPNFAEP